MKVVELGLKVSLTCTTRAPLGGNCIKLKTHRSWGGCNVTLPGPSLQSLCSAAEYVYFMTALDVAILNNPIISGNCDRIKPIDEPAEEYDFIVAGGGAGGSAVAGRLAEISEWKILVLEAGKDESAAGQVPSFAGTLIGRVSLASNNPLDYPVMWGNFLSDPSDLEVILDGLEMSLKLTEAEALKAYNLTLAVQLIEACLNYTIPSREYWAYAIRQNTRFGLHQAGSCKMGPASDYMAVVDPELRVHGIKNLCVVDTSIMPQVTSSNTGVPTMVIGERGADFINKDLALIL